MGVLSDYYYGGYRNALENVELDDEVRQLETQNIQRRAEMNPFISTLAGSLKGNLGSTSTALGNIAGRYGFDDVSKGLYQYGRGLQKEAAPYIAPQTNFRTINGLGGALDFASANIAQGLGSMLPIIVGQRLGGAPLGLGAAYLPLHGENVARLKADPRTAGMSESEMFRYVAPTAAAQAGLEYIVPGGVLARGLERGIGPGRAAAFATLPAGMAVEGATETGQEWLKQQMHSLANPARPTAADKEDLLQSFVAGAVGGAPVSAMQGAAMALKPGAQPLQDSMGTVKNYFRTRGLPDGVTDADAAEFIRERDVQDKAAATRFAESMANEATVLGQKSREFLKGSKTYQEVEMLMRTASNSDYANKAREVGQHYGSKLHDFFATRLGSAMQFNDPATGLTFNTDDRARVLPQGPDVDRVIEALSDKDFRKKVNGMMNKEWGLPKGSTMSAAGLLKNSDDALKRGIAKWMQTGFGADMSEDGEVYIPEPMLGRGDRDFVELAKSMYAAMQIEGVPLPPKEVAEQVFAELENAEARRADLAAYGRVLSSEGGNAIVDNEGLEANLDDGIRYAMADEIGTDPHEMNTLTPSVVHLGKSDLADVAFNFVPGDENGEQRINEMAKLEAARNKLRADGREPTVIGAVDRAREEAPDEGAVREAEDAVIRRYVKKEAVEAVLADEKLRAKTLESLNTQYLYLRDERTDNAEDSMVRGEEFNNITPGDKRNKWAINPVGRDGKSYAGPEFGTVWFQRATDGKAFAVPAWKLIKLGRGADTTSEVEGQKEHLAALHTGIASFMTAQVNGKPALSAFGTMIDGKLKRNVLSPELVLTSAWVPAKDGVEAHKAAITKVGKAPKGVIATAREHVRKAVEHRQGKDVAALQKLLHTLDTETLDNEQKAAVFAQIKDALPIARGPSLKAAREAVRTALEAKMPLAARKLQDLLSTFDTALPWKQQQTLLRDVVAQTRELEPQTRGYRLKRDVEQAVAYAKKLGNLDGATELEDMYEQFGENDTEYVKKALADLQAANEDGAEMGQGNEDNPMQVFSETGTISRSIGEDFEAPDKKIFRNKDTGEVANQGPAGGKLDAARSKPEGPSAKEKEQVAWVVANLERGVPFFKRMLTKDAGARLKTVLDTLKSVAGSAENALVWGDTPSAQRGSLKKRALAMLHEVRDLDWGLDVDPLLKQMGEPFAAWFANIEKVLVLDLKVPARLKGRLIEINTQTDPDMYPRILAHEAAHSVDRITGRFISDTDPELAVERVDGERVPVGPVAKEVFDFIRTRPDAKLTGWLNREHSQTGSSLVDGAAHDAQVMREMFARLGEVYILHPGVMQKTLPLAHAYMEKRNAQIKRELGVKKPRRPVREEVRLSPGVRGHSLHGGGQGVVRDGDAPSAGDRGGVSGHVESTRVLTSQPFAKVKLPVTSLFTPKDQAKSDKANKFIGRGSARSSTAEYAKTWGDRANAGQYTSSDTVFLSVEGDRNGRIGLDKVELQKAMTAGATIITDDTANRNRAYNVGEREAAAYLTEKGYKEAAPGAWKPGAESARVLTEGVAKASPETYAQMFDKLAKLFATQEKRFVEHIEASSREDGGRRGSVFQRHSPGFVRTGAGRNLIRDLFFATQGGENKQLPFDRVTPLVNENGVTVSHWDVGFTGSDGKNLGPVYLTTELRGEDFHLNLIPAKLGDIRPKATDLVRDIDKAVVRVHLRNTPDGYEIHVGGVKEGSSAYKYLKSLGVDLSTDQYTASGNEYFRYPAGHANTKEVLSMAIRMAYAATGKQQAVFYSGRDTGANPRVRRKGVDSDAVPQRFNAQKPETGKALSADEQQALREALEKRLGDKVKLLFEDEILNKGGNKTGFSADWGPGLVRVLGKLNFNDATSMLHHEAMHEFFHRLRGEPAADRVAGLLTRAASAAPIRKQLERLLAEHPNALKQLGDANERLAYMYQFWKAGKLNLGTQTESTFKKIENFLRRVTGLLSDEQKTEALLQAFDSGALKGEPSVAAQVLEQMEARGALLNRANEMIEPIRDRFAKTVFTAQGQLDRSENSALAALSRMFNVPEGETGPQGMFEARAQMSAKFLNRFDNALRGASKVDIDAALEALQLENGKPPRSAEARKLYAEVRTILDDMHNYITTAGVKRLEATKEGGKWVPVSKRQNYFPVVYDIELISKDPSAFVNDLIEQHTPEIRQRMEHLGFRDADKPDNVRGYAEAIVKRLINSHGAAELDESTADLGFSPVMTAVNERSLEWVSTELRAKYQSKDLVSTMSSYIIQGVKRAEYVRRFDNGGAKIKRMLKVAVKEASEKLERDTGLSEADALNQAAEDIAQYSNAIMALEGTLGNGMDPAWRNASGMMITYQNWRLLTMALFSSFIDPLGIMVRGGTMQDAYDTFTRGLREVALRWKDEKNTDEQTAVAETLGTVDAGSFMEALGQTYSSLYLHGKMKRWNDKLFMFNGMEAWNRGMRVGATQAAIGFIQRHSDNPSANGKRWLAELYGEGGTPAMKNGKLDLTDANNQQAIMRWVDGAILRPNAAQRPAWGSDPHWAVIWHMKQFTYTFHKVILTRIAHEMQQGNLNPMMTLAAGYIPMMIAADAAKSLLLTQDEPDWMKQGLDSMVWHGAMRANVMGIPQLGLDAYDKDAFGLAGPAVEWAKDWVTEPLGKQSLRSLPGGSALGQVFKSAGGNSSNQEGEGRVE